ncbi:MAG: SMC-Scp complex subunit ScpB [bacterium]
MLTLPELSKILEGVLFLSPKPVSADDIAVNLGENKERVKEAFALLGERYADSGLELMEVAGGYELATRKEYIDHLKIFFSNLDKTRLSRAALETAAIIAYKQPITRAEIESIRGVNSSGVIHSLLEKNLVRITGKAEAAGRPYLFVTTPDFLRLLGINDISELPAVDSLEKKI